MLLGDNTDGGVVVLPPIGLRCVGSLDLNWTALCKHIYFSAHVLNSDLRTIRLASLRTVLLPYV